MSQPIREVTVGCKVPEDGSLAAFGEEEIEELIRLGWRVISVKVKGAMMRKMPAAAGAEARVGFVGFAVVVQLAAPGPSPAARV